MKTIMSKQLFLLTALAIGILVALAILLSRGKPHYPVVRAVVPGGVILTFIETPWNDANRCVEENLKVTNILRQQCPQCRIEFSECREQLNLSWEKSVRDEPGDFFTVHTGTQRIVIEADPKTSQEVCIGMADQIEHQKKQHARCVKPVT